MFIQCFDEETRDKLLSMGLKQISKKEIGKSIVYIFDNSSGIKNFENLKISFSNRLTF